MRHSGTFTRYLVAAIFCAASLYASAAEAACTVRGGSFFPAQNDTVSYDAVVTGDGRCDRTFTTRGLAFKSTSIVKRPANGSLSTSGPAAFVYQAKSRFKGADSFIVKVCAEGNAGAGCSTLNYTVKVE